MMADEMSAPAAGAPMTGVTELVTMTLTRSSGDGELTRLSKGDDIAYLTMFERMMRAFEVD